MSTVDSSSSANIRKGPRSRRMRFEDFDRVSRYRVSQRVSDHSLSVEADVQDLPTHAVHFQR
jgi:hypothetical protein